MVADVSSTGASLGMPRALSGTTPVRNGDGRAATGTATVVTLSTDAQQQLRTLKQADSNVRQHEAAHQSTGGAHAGSAAFTYTRGPDGKTYATAGEVQVDISAEADPSATVSKMDQVKAAALAPSDPSPQDLRVAAQADALKLKAQSDARRAEGGAATGASEAASGDSSSRALAARGTAAYGAAQALGTPPRPMAGMVV